jgi:hypothetical protein
VSLNRAVALSLVVGASFLVPSPARGDDTCATSSSAGLRVRTADGFPAGLEHEVVTELRSILRPRGLAVCTGDRLRGAGAYLDTDATGVIRIRVFRRDDGPEVERPSRDFDPRALPHDAVAFALARAIDELLQHAEVIPRAETPITLPAETAPEAVSDESAEMEAGPSPADERGSPGDAAAEREPTSWPAWLVSLGALGGLYVDGSALLGAALGVGLRLGAFSFELGTAGSIGLARDGPRGSVGVYVLEGTFAAVARLLPLGNVQVWGGAVAGAGVVSMRGEANEPSASFATSAEAFTVWVGPRLRVEGRLSSAWSLFTELDGRVILVGVEGRDGETPVVQLGTWATTAVIGVAWTIR